MIIGLCATRNMYPQLQQSIAMLLSTQSTLEKIYAFVEDDFEVPEDCNVIFINVANFKPIKENETNGKSHWTYMSLTRCYFTELLPTIDKILYLDLDIMITQDLQELWNIDIDNYALAGVIDTGIKAFHVPYIEDLNKYINSGAVLMNLKYMREHNMDKELDRILHKYFLLSPDQDALNIVCSNAIKYLDCKWNSSDATTLSKEPMINHVIRTKPWDPNSKWFPQWAMTYLHTGAKQSIAKF